MSVEAGTLAPGLVQARPDRVGKTAPTDEAEEEISDRLAVHPGPIAASGSSEVGERLHDRGFITFLAAVQLAWLAALVYGVVLLASLAR
jgi:hypothetical protein